MYLACKKDSLSMGTTIFSPHKKVSYGIVALKRARLAIIVFNFSGGNLLLPERSVYVFQRFLLKSDSIRLKFIKFKSYLSSK